MKKNQLLGLALVLLLVPFVLISIGTTTDNPTLWWAGLIMLVIGALIPPATRFFSTADADEEEAEDGASGDEKESEDDRRGEDRGGDERRREEREGDLPEPPDLEGVSIRPIAHEPDPQRQRGTASPAEQQAEQEARARERKAEAHRKKADAHREEARAADEEARAADEEARAAELRARADAERARRERGDDSSGPPAV